MKHFILLLLFPLGIFAQDSSVIKKRAYKIPTWDEKTGWQHRISAGYAVLYPGQSALAPYKAYLYGDFISNRGWTFSNSLIRNFRRNPVSIIADISFTQNTVNMVLYDTFGVNGNLNPKRNYYFKNFSLADVGIGAEIEGKYIFADIEYRIGYLWGGTTKDTSTSQPEIVRNGKLNLNSTIYQGLQLGLGLRYKNFHVKLNGNLPLTRFQINMYKDWECSVLFRSLTVGYTWGLVQK